jgi:hypothetical protein
MTGTFARAGRSQAWLSFMEEALWQREHGERATKVGVLLEAGIAANSTQTKCLVSDGEEQSLAVP